MTERALLTDYKGAVNTDGTPVDPYTAIAAFLFNVRYEAVTPKMREDAKAATLRHSYTNTMNRGEM